MQRADFNKNEIAFLAKLKEIRTPRIDYILDTLNPDTPPNDALATNELLLTYVRSGIELVKEFSKDREPDGAIEREAACLQELLLWILSVADYQNLEGWKVSRGLELSPEEDVKDFYAQVLDLCDKSPTLGIQHLKRILDGAHTHARWLSCGLPIFSITHSLFSALVLTDPPNVRAEELVVPYSTFFIRAPYPFWDMTMPGTDRRSPVLGLWVHKHMYEGKPNLTLSVTAQDGALPLDFHLDREPDYASWISDIEKFTSVFPSLSGTDQKPLPVPRDMKQLSLAAVRLFVNTCLYLSEKKGKEESTDRPRNSDGPRSRGKAEVRPDTILLGKEVKIDKNIMDSAKSWLAISKGKRGAWSIHSRFLVRGHWRKQVFGPRPKLPDGTRAPWSQRRWTRIEPHYKGSDGPLLQHIYKLGEESSPLLT